MGSGSAGFQEGSGGAVGKEGLKATGGAVEVFETSIDRFGGAVAGAGVVEVGQHVEGPSFQGSTEGDQLGELRGHSVGEVVDHGL